MQRRTFIKGILSLGLISQASNVHASIARMQSFIRKRFDLVVFAGGAGFQIAGSFIELPKDGGKINYRTLIIGDFTYASGKATPPAADFYIYISEAFASKYSPFVCGPLYDERLSLAKAEIEGVRKWIRDNCKSVTAVIGLGGHTGTFAGGAIAEIAREENIPIRQILTTPFSFEGNRNKLAEEYISRASRSFDERLVILDNQDVYSELNPTTTLPAAMDYLNKRAAKAIFLINT